MATKIIHKKSSVANRVPVSADLEVGEIALNLTDQKIYSKQTDGTVVEMSPNPDQLALTETCKNVSGGSLAIGTPVYQSGTSGNAMEVQAARADTAGSMPAVGILSQTLANDAEGTLVLTGFVQGLDTSAFSEGDTLYIAATGGITNTAPAGEANLIQNIGKVIKVHASNGSIMVTGAGRANATPNLDDGNFFLGNASNQAETAVFATEVNDLIGASSVGDLSDVDTTTVAPTEGQVLTWDNTAGKWEPTTPSGSGDLISTNNLSELTDYAAARTNLGLAIGTDVQAYDANYVVDATYVATDENFTTADHTKLDGIEAGADVTDTVNVTAAGALMDSEVTNLAAVKAFDPTDYVAVTGDEMTGSLYVNGGIIRGAVNSVAASTASTTLDMTAGNFHIVDMSSTTTFSFSNLAGAVASSGTIVIKQDATGGRSFTLPSEAKTPVGGASINQVTTASTTSIISYMVVSSSEVLVNYIGDFA